MQSGPKCVTVLDGSGSQNMLQHFIPDEAGRYRVPLVTNTDAEYNNCLNLLNWCKEGYFPEPDFTYKVAVLDTGILPEHPIFKRYVKGHKDFTGEGIADGNGHGSLVTWQFLIASDLTKTNVELYIGKILTSDGTGTEKSIIDGLEWAASQGVRLINLSAGIDNRIWFGLKECKATCDVCKTAYRLKEKDIMLVAAAGNNGKTVCPAKVGLYYDDSLVVSVGAVDNQTGNKEAWSGEGNMYAAGTVYVGDDAIIF